MTAEPRDDGLRAAIATSLLRSGGRVATRGRIEILERDLREWLALRDVPAEPPNARRCDGVVPGGLECPNFAEWLGTVPNATRNTIYACDRCRGVDDANGDDDPLDVGADAIFWRRISARSAVEPTEPTATEIEAAAKAMYEDEIGDLWEDASERDRIQSCITATTALRAAIAARGATTPEENEGE